MMKPLLIVLALALAGCAGFSPDGGMSAVDRLARERTGQSPRLLRTDEDRRLADARAGELLRAPLSADAAVELAMLRHAGLQAALGELGIAEADLVAAGRLRNPVFSFLDVRSPENYKIERAFVFDVLGLLSMPRRVELGRARFEQAQTQAAREAVAVAVDARSAWVSAVASQQLVRYAEQVQEAADASAELARRMQRAGNFTRLAQLREQAFQADATAQLARARHQAVADRERLVRALGLSGADLAFTLPERLPELPASPPDARDAEQLALARRLDVQAARQANDTLARSLGLTRVTRVVDGFELGYANLSEGGERRRDGYTVALPIPLFDWGESRVARAEAQYLQSVQRSVQVAVDARSQVREQWSAWRSAHALARHYRDEVVPLARQISDEQLARYNGMLASPFEILADARDQVRSVIGAIATLRDFWLADVALQTAMTTGSPGSPAGSTALGAGMASGPSAAATAPSGVAGH